MYLSETSQPFLLPPRAYFAADVAEREESRLLRPAWHPIGLSDHLARPGQFVTATVLGVPVVVRRFGEDETSVAAFRNVCSHRHCTIVGDARGTSAKLRCPYHGWEYGHDGLTRRIPKAKNFPHFDREAHRLDAFEVARCGGLWLVRLGEAESLQPSETLRSFLGHWYDWIAERTSPPLWKPALETTLPADANWKIPIEGSLESYHLDDVHAKSFGADADPGEENTEHTIETAFTSFATNHRPTTLMTRLEDAGLETLGIANPSGRYEQHHLFPNLMLAHLPSMTLVTSVMPTSPTRCELRLWQWGPQPRGSRTRTKLFGPLVARTMGQMASRASVTVLKEDVAIFPSVQAGLAARNDVDLPRGIFGRCEERLAAFHRYVDMVMVDD